MGSVAKAIRFVFKAIILFFGLMLLLAILWTLLQVAAAYSRRQEEGNALEARQKAYRATGTALASESPDAQLLGEPAIVLVQQLFTTSTPQPHTPSPPPATPGPIDLPKLYSAANPAAGLVLSGTAVPRPADPIPRDYKLVNVILLGGDDELTADNFVRTDTMIVVSLNLETGTVSMLNLPRDLFIYIPRGTMGRLNTAYGIGEYINWQPDGGFGLLRQTIFYNFGINVHYYARVNFTGFESIIDHLGGVDIAVDCTYRDLYPVDDFKPGASAASNYRWRTLNVGYYSFDGFDALWYARTRKYTDDLDRGRRQQQLLRSMWRKARSNGLITTIPALWGEVTSTIDTNVPFDVMLSLLPYLVNLDLESIQNLTFRRIYHTRNWNTPKGESVLLPQPEAIVELLTDFYTPPTSNQLSLAGPSIAVYNASGNENWDLVASERLRWDGYNSVALGTAEEDTVLPSSRLIDHVAASKGSIVSRLTKALNMTRKQVETAADPARDYDYEVILGSDYESCTYGVLPIDG